MAFTPQLFRVEIGSNLYGPLPKVPQRLKIALMDRFINKLDSKITKYILGQSGDR